MTYNVFGGTLNLAQSVGAEVSKMRPKRRGKLRLKYKLENCHLGGSLKVTVVKDCSRQF